MRTSVVGHSIEFSDQAWQDLERLGDVTSAAVEPCEKNLRDHARDAEVLITWGRVTTAVLDALPDLRLLVLLSTGYEEALDDEAVAALRERGIAAAYTPGYATQAVAEYAVAAVLAGYRRLVPASRAAAAGDRAFAPFLGKQLAGSTVGVVGLGVIGGRVAALTRALGAEVAATTLHPARPRDLGFAVRSLALDELCSVSDAVVLTCQLDAGTRHLVDAAKLALMKDDVVLVNAARADVVNWDDLRDFLRAHPRATVVLDDVSPDTAAGQEVRCMANAVLTPHLAFYTAESLRRCADIAVGNVTAFAHGRLENRIC